MERTQRLEEILRIARQQRELMRGSDLESISILQQKRQQLLDEIQLLDGSSPDEKIMTARILEEDREINWLLQSKLLDIQEKMNKLATVRKLLRTHRPTEKGTRPRLSCHV